MPPADPALGPGDGRGDPAAVVRVRLFAHYRDAAGAAEIVRPLCGADGRPRTVGALWAALVADHPSLAAVPPAAAVNAILARFERVLAPGDEVAFLPPVSGG